MKSVLVAGALALSCQLVHAAGTTPAGLSVYPLSGSASLEFDASPAFDVRPLPHLNGLLLVPVGGNPDTFVWVSRHPIRRSDSSGKAVRVQWRQVVSSAAVAGGRGARVRDKGCRKVAKKRLRCDLTREIAATGLGVSESLYWNKGGDLVLVRAQAGGGVEKADETLKKIAVKFR